ncbi:Phosphoribosylglycinamide formyltransferase (5'-phosphoribosylglycinamide transformylase) (GAR transformylase) (GART) [Candidatus Glomeribacter gigasporarum BEG34]|uniref:Phosphoribosylglycinamide formyltransferase n=1 Tax=Candidatus Glomeribacter gigasporarum BEG34 TaxID=1070319 RepID=G2J9H8_9BURK|nr:phosphoribosylglycinamide formyltransferase [Candidatus Glomeribacter gigasporarum]CCD29425.1 Phosphoribosylglycinamide formyltransferase (5'-phosphoribosylglycinamide transformylase) (GAR transformylase) (GART) [Candidatus Glomeribacter gigasporarum BEG34]
MRNLVILISGRGSNMQALVRARAQEQWPARIQAVISDRADAPGLAFAAAQRIRTVVVEARAHTRASFEAALMEAIDALAADFIVLAGFMRILTPAFVARYAQRILNIHPSLLPSFPGLNTHQRALEAGVQLHGATVHFVTPRLDDGPIIAQAAVPVMATDDAGTLAARVLEAEHQLYPRALRWCVEGRLSVQNARALLTPPEPQWLIFDGNAPLV